MQDDGHLILVCNLKFPPRVQLIKSAPRLGDIALPSNKLNEDVAKHVENEIDLIEGSVREWSRVSFSYKQRCRAGEKYFPHVLSNTNS